MMAGKYMAYVGSYSYNGQAKGITVYDVDVENGYFKYRCEDACTGSVGNDRKYYSRSYGITSRCGNWTWTQKGRIP